MLGLTQKLPYCLLDGDVDAACRAFDMEFADRLADAAELGDLELLMKLLDMVDWVDNSRRAAAASARLN
jgi:hypothetical protein